MIDWDQLSCNRLNHVGAMGFCKCSRQSVGIELGDSADCPRLVANSGAGLANYSRLEFPPQYAGVAPTVRPVVLTNVRWHSA